MFLLFCVADVGFTLRKEDPLALKEFITTVQTKAGTVGSSLKEVHRFELP